jgi:hypothetical protein
MNRPLLVLAFLLLPAIVGGCSTVTVETPEGLKVTTTSLFTNRGIEEARYGPMYIKGYGSATATDAIKAAAEGAAAGAVRVAP